MRRGNVLFSFEVARLGLAILLAAYQGLPSKQKGSTRVASPDLQAVTPLRLLSFLKGPMTIVSATVFVYMLKAETSLLEAFCDCAFRRSIATATGDTGPQCRFSAKPDDMGRIVAFALDLPNTASVAEIPINWAQEPAL